MAFPWMALGAVGSLLGGLGGLMGASNSGSGARADRDAAGWTSLANLWMQDRTNQQNQANWNVTNRREDTAVQRRVADLRAAGLSPVLAAGSAAQSSGPIMARAPQLEGMIHNRQAQQQMALQNATNVAQTLTGMMAAYQQVRLTSAQADTAEAKGALAKSYAMSELEEIRQRTASGATRSALDKLEHDYIKEHGTKVPGETGIAGQIRDLMRMLLDPETESGVDKLFKRSLLPDVFKKERVPLKHHQHPSKVGGRG